MSSYGQGAGRDARKGLWCHQQLVVQCSSLQPYTQVMGRPPHPCPLPEASHWQSISHDSLGCSADKGWEEGKTEPQAQAQEQGPPPPTAAEPNSWGLCNPQNLDLSPGTVLLGLQNK